MAVFWIRCRVAKERVITSDGRIEVTDGVVKDNVFSCGRIGGPDVVGKEREYSAGRVMAYPIALL